MIQLTKQLVVTADKHCYIVGEPRQSVVEGCLPANPGKDMPQPLDGEKEE